MTNFKWAGFKRIIIFCAFLWALIPASHARQQWNAYLAVRSYVNSEKIYLDNVVQQALQTKRREHQALVGTVTAQVKQKEKDLPKFIDRMFEYFLSMCLIVVSPFFFFYILSWFYSGFKNRNS